VAYRVRPNRTPLMLGSAIVGSAVLVFGIYMLTSGPSTPPAPTDVTSQRAPGDPGPASAPTPGSDQATSSVTPTGPAANVPTTTFSALPRAQSRPPPLAAPPPFAQAPRPPPPAARPPPRPPAAKNPPPTPAAGGIVRDNPF
jgi:hypothetical protein